MHRKTRSGRKAHSLIPDTLEDDKGTKHDSVPYLIDQGSTDDGPNER